MSDTFVLITGAWHGGWAWRPVAEHLRAAGKCVLTPTLPGLRDGEDPTGYSLADVVASIVDLVESNDLRDVTLVGHSWGGYPMTGAASLLKDRLAKVIYWSAFVPADGRSLFDELPKSYQDLFIEQSAASGNNTVRLPFEVWQAGFIQDATPEVQRLTHELLVPHPMQYFTEPVTALEPPFGVPISYVLTEDDISQPLDETGWSKYIKRLNVTPILTPGSHEACFTTPRSLAQALLLA